MIFGFIFLRLLFIACMVFIIGYVFGPFSRNRTLTVITKVSAILALVLFMATSAFFFRFGGGWRGGHQAGGHYRSCVHDTAPRQAAAAVFNGN
jgi:hypothetical protein